MAVRDGEDCISFQENVTTFPGITYHIFHEATAVVE